MGSFLKRISPMSQLQSRILKQHSKVYFDLDEPDFVLKRKFCSNSRAYASNLKVKPYLTNKTIACPQCGNTEFAQNSKFCKICGYEVYPE